MPKTNMARLYPVKWKSPTVDVIAPRVLAWHKMHGRHHLPWQHRPPYEVWVSEIMLQQTQVETVEPYFLRFMENFPTVAQLAEAPLSRVLSLWSGLGYYARARNLHKAAKILAATGGFPKKTNMEFLMTLPGVGRSTAAAILALAYQQAEAILDGNVRRLFMRVFALSKTEEQRESYLWALAKSLLPPATEVADYTQALMDLGAGVCVRKNPKCAICPLQDVCGALVKDLVSTLPPAKIRPAKASQNIYWCFWRKGEKVWLTSRGPTGIWGGLMVPFETSPAHMRALKLKKCMTLVHELTHRKFLIHIYEGKATGQFVESDDGQWLSLTEALASAIPAPVRKILLQLHEQGFNPLHHPT